MSAREPVNGLWKYVATISVTILLAGSPGMVYALRTWSVIGDIDAIKARQDDVRLRLAVLEEKNTVLTAAVTDLQTQVRDLRLAKQR